MQKTIVVTGGTRGIGRAIIEKFAKAGHDVITCARNRRDLQHLKTSIETTYGIKCLVFQANLASKEQVLAFATFIKNNDCDIHCLVNNAGVSVSDFILKTDDGLLEKLMEINLYAAFYLTNSLAEDLIKTKGHIFNICSVASIEAVAKASSFTISKFALLGFNKALRQEMKPHGVKVTALLPEAVNTSETSDDCFLADNKTMADAVADTLFMAYSLSKSSVVEELIIRPL